MSKSADYKVQPWQWTHGVTRFGAEMKDALLVEVNSRAVVRQAIIDRLRREGVRVETRSDWKAKEPRVALGIDWDYRAIAIHHAGNSFSCAADGAAAMRKIEAEGTDRFDQISYHYAIDCRGVVYEALDIRFKGAHIKLANTGVIGIVFLADLSVRDEASQHGPGIWKVTKQDGLKDGFAEWMGEIKDKFAVDHDSPTEHQLVAASALCKTLAEYFHIRRLGGHREFLAIQGSSRACPGIHGMIVADMLRRELGVEAP
jgi:N-acetylmuramoyl-L-alanine amidase-like protein